MVRTGDRATAANCHTKGGSSHNPAGLDIERNQTRPDQVERVGVGTCLEDRLSRLELAQGGQLSERVDFGFRQTLGEGVRTKHLANPLTRDGVGHGRESSQ